MKVIITVLCLAALAAGALLFGRTFNAGDLARVEWVLAAVAVMAIGARWWVVVRRRQRQKLQEMRDSALW